MDASRLQKQFAKTLAKVLSDPQLSVHRFFGHWLELNPGAPPAELYQYCVQEAEPYGLVGDIAMAVAATWPEMTKAHGNPLAAARATHADAALVDLCCHMSLVAFERAIHADPAGRPSLDNGVLNVGMFAREAAAIAAAVWIGSGLKLQTRSGSEQPLQVINLIHEHGETQFRVGFAGCDRLLRPSA